MFSPHNQGLERLIGEIEVSLADVRLFVAEMADMSEELAERIRCLIRTARGG